MPEELLLDRLIQALLFRLLFQDLLDLIVVGVVFVDFPLVVGAQLVSGVVEVVCSHDVALVVLAHAQPVDC